MARLERVLRPAVTAAVSAVCIAALPAFLTSCARSTAADHSGAVVAQVSAETDRAVRVESLIDEELLMRRALSSHLDSDPTVMKELDRARRQILARAYEEHGVLPHTEISSAAKHEYYRANPVLFAHRRIYRTATFSIARTELTSALRNSLDHARSAGDVRQSLDQHSIRFDAVETSRPAEEIPMILLPQLAQAAPGDLLILSPPHEAHAMLVWLVDAQDRPLDFEHASKQIGQYLTDSRNRQILAQYLRHARSGADIAYIGAGNTAELEADVLE
jgi:EpsD family peptidyl-prolyl cis-trans isomerase